MDDYTQRTTALMRAIAAHPQAGFGLAKPTSNVFRQAESYQQPVKVKDFDHVLEVNAAAGWVDVEGMTTYEKLVAATLPHGVMPAVVPQLKSITIGGAVSGGGIEASSFRYGLVHETILSVDVLLASGEVVTCTPDNEYQDLFFGLPNSYGTLGYILKVRAKVVPVKPYVQLQHTKYHDVSEYLQAIEYACAQAQVHFVDGTIFAPDEMYLTVGTFVETAPFTSDYTFEHIYYRSIREKQTDYLTTADFIWRWDTDWFWCSKNVGMHNPLLRRLMGRRRLNSITYTKLMRLNSRWKVTHALEALRRTHSESVIQDVDIPIKNVAAFLDFFHKEIGILPIWICPFRRVNTRQFDLYPLTADQLYINLGFWDIIRRREPIPAGYFNKKVEHYVRQLGGIKSLYSSVFYDEDTFWDIYNRPVATQLKAKYDPRGRFKNLYQKVVLQQT